MPRAARLEHGDVLGVARGDITAHFNATGAAMTTGENRVDGVFTGMKWQCVEFGRRWLFRTQGVVFNDVAVAADIWRETHVVRPSDGKTFPLTAYPNGSTEPPRAGDLVIYDKSSTYPGHVAAITEVDLDAGILRLAEQNYDNEPWPGDYARTLRLRRIGEAFVLADSGRILGWMRVRRDAESDGAEGFRRSIERSGKP